MTAPSILPPNPSLVAILLVIKALSGPRLVFHYPPHPACPSSPLPAHPQWYSTSTTHTDDESTSSSSTGWSSDSSGDASDEASEANGGSRAGSRGTSVGTSRGTGLRDGSRRGQRSLRSTSEDVEEEGDDDDTGLGDEEGRGAPGQSGAAKGAGAQEDAGPQWENLMGFKSEGLEKLLCPGRGFNKRKFEVSMEGLTFLGHPMFAKGNGAWRKRKRGRDAEDEKQEDARPSNADADGQDENATPDTEDEGVDMTAPEDGMQFDLPSGFEAGYGHQVSDEASDAGSDAKSASTAGGDTEMTMFNVVFVLNPPALEYQLRTGEVYDNVIRKFAKDLKYEQAKSNYVWRESRTISAMKNKAKESRDPISSLWHSIISASPLAKSIAIIFDAISNSKIAHIHLDTLADASYQIPQAPSTPYIPRATEPQMPGLWLTTANLPDEHAEANYRFSLSLTSHSALLLLEDKETLLKEIEGDAKEHSAQLAFYISNLTPTKSLHKLALMHKIPVADLEFISAHLIYWRRARAIPPLHQRDTYIVSPNADMRMLPQAIPAYASRFPTLPSLPKMLSLLSNQPPRTYGSLIPSKDHRSAYMEILAWLMRGGWVTQLRTFAWIRVSPEVQAEVAAIMQREAKDAARAAVAAARERHAALELHSDDASDRATIASEDVPSTPHRTRSPRMSNSNSETSDASSNRSGSIHTTIHSSSSAAGNPSSSNATNTSPTAHRNSPFHASHSTASLTDSMALSTSSMPHGTPSSTPQRPHHHHHHHHRLHADHNDHFPAATAASKDPADYSPRMIYSPQKANALEARWIEHLRSSFEDNKEVRELWPVLQKYFDGTHALDDIAGREGIKRKRVWGVLGVLRERNVLCVMRHW